MNKDTKQDRIIYGAEKIGLEIGKSESTIRRYAKRPGGEFLQVSSMSNEGGGYGRALRTFQSSIHAFGERVDAETRCKHQAAAVSRWTANTDVSSR